MKLIAFFLPQFHPTPYNDQWWGQGFTDWTNVTRAVPQFEGHFQPRLPQGLGFYDLRVDEVMMKQEMLAQQYGIDGFCYYYYRFDGRRLLDIPLEKKWTTTVGFTDPTPKFKLPFCICWANESWTRRWDGLDLDILIKQNHSQADDLDFIQEVAPMLIDPRYIKVEGKPLLLIYRTELWPDIATTAQLWRDYMTQHFKCDLYLVRCNGFEEVNPTPLGFDAAYQFPPQRLPEKLIPKDQVSLERNFAGYLRDYAVWPDFVKYSPNFKLFRGVMPAWDHTPRRQSKAIIFYGSSPEVYQEWLTQAITYTQQHFQGDEQLVFINAWNEWAEGAILEPCTQWGFQYLKATLDVTVSSVEN